MENPRAAYKDYYYVLGLTASASQGQIQAAYNELYDKFGPHVSAEELDPEAMAKAYRDISEAYEVLREPRSRAEYDKKAAVNKQTSSDLRDLWLKKSGLNAAEAAAAQAAEDISPSSWIKRTATGSNPVYEDEKSQSSSSARNPAFNPTASSQRNPVFNPTASSQRNPVFNPTADTRGNSAYDSGGAPNTSTNYSGNDEYNPAEQSSYGATSNYGGSDVGYTEDFAEHSQNYLAQPGHESVSRSSAVSLELEITITLKEAFKGTTREIVVTDPVTCTQCMNMKPVLRMQCTQCHGVGTYNVDRKEEIVLAAGMYDGMEISKPEQGRYDMRAGRKGDLIVKIKLARHALLGVNGRDVTCSVPVTIYEAMLGAEIQAPCATGKVTLKIQPLTQPGRVYRLKGMGLCGADQLVTIEVVLPSRLSGDEVAVYKKLREGFKEPNPRDKFFEKG